MYFEVRETQSGLDTSRTGYPVTQSGTGTGASLLEPHLSEEQAGFRKDRSTVHQILTLRLIAEKAKRHRKKIYNCFIDFQKAFDTIKHKVIWAVLRSNGIEEKMITLLQKIYEKAQSAV